MEKERDFLVNKERKKLISSFAVLSVSVFIIIGALYIASDLSPAFADLINGSLSQDFRRLMASFGNIFPFSLFEALIICIPLIIFFVVYTAMKRFSDRNGRIRFVVNLSAFVLLIYSGHILALGIGYKTTPVSEKMELSEVEVTEENLTLILTDLRDELNSLSSVVPRGEDGVFNPEYSYETISGKICASYDKLVTSYGLPKGYNSRAKRVYFGNVMSYLGITGIYTYVTGEANVNSAYPAYVTIFTSAHEMCHQRGILRENEANFIAYLITATSDDANLRYSGALNMYSYFSSALYKTNKDAYYSIASGLSDFVKTDIRAASAVSEKYGDTIIEEISDKINDIYLESSGSEGIVSYSRVVELVIAYRDSNR